MKKIQKKSGHLGMIKGTDLPRQVVINGEAVYCLRISQVPTPVWFRGVMDKKPTFTVIDARQAKKAMPFAVWRDRTNANLMSCAQPRNTPFILLARALEAKFDLQGVKKQWQVFANGGVVEVYHD